jgi:AraC-like DNA-binding protein
MEPDVDHLQLYSTLRRIGAAPPEIIELFDYLEDAPLWVKDVVGHYQWVNIAFLQNFGLHNRAEILGHTDYELCSLELAEQYRLDDEKVLRGERILSRVELIGRFGHTSRWCVTSKIPLRNAAGEIVGTAGITHPLDQHALAAPASARLSAAIRHISQRYNSAITNKDLAKVCGLSLRAFERQFRATYGCSPHDYLRQLRVRMSCRALVFSSVTLAGIASDYGFADQSHFTKEFRRIMGETPRAYRERHQSP